MRNIAIKWINHNRREELEALRSVLESLPAQAKLLEIGGGNGFLAQRLAEMGFDIISIDPKPRQPAFYPVQHGHCDNLDFADDSFDAIFSSNVLEHVDDLPAALAEMKRVLKPNGTMIHTMPTPFTTVLTMITQPIGYLFGLGFVFNQIIKFLTSRLRLSPKSCSNDSRGPPSGSVNMSLNRTTVATTLKMLNPLRLIVCPPHGTSPSCLTELRDWRPDAWKKKFQQAGFRVNAVVDLPMTYSRHSVLPFCLITLRKHLAASGKTSCRAFVVQKNQASRDRDMDSTV